MCMFHLFLYATPPLPSLRCRELLLYCFLTVTPASTTTKLNAALENELQASKERADELVVSIR